MLGNALQKSLRLRRFKLDLDEILQDRSYTHWLKELDFSYFQDSGHDVRLHVVTASMQRRLPAARWPAECV